METDQNMEQVNTKERPEGEQESLEELFTDLDEILSRMELTDIPLEEAFALYEQGMKKIRSCNEKLDLVEKKMQVIAEDGTEVPFE